MDGCVGFCGVKIFKRMDTQMRSLHSSFIGLTKKKSPLGKTNKPTNRTKSNTCCHDDARQHLPPGVRRREVLSQLAELVDDQAGHGVCEDLRWQQSVSTLVDQMPRPATQKGPCHKQAPFELHSPGDAN